MKRKKQILNLIESEIVSSKLVLTLNSISIDADNYFTDISVVILIQMGIKKQKRTDDLYQAYFEMIRQGQFLDLTVPEERYRLATKIYNYLTAKT